MKIKFIILLILLAVNFFAYTLTDESQINSNILSCQQNGFEMSFCKTPAVPISSGYIYEMEFDLSYSFACFGSPMTLAFNTSPHDASYLVSFNSNPRLSDKENSTTIKVYGTSVSLIDLNPDLTYNRTYFSPCNFIIKTFAVDLSSNTKNILELYLKSMQQIDVIIPLAKNLKEQVSLLKILFSTVDLQHLHDALFGLKTTIQQTMKAISEDVKSRQAFNFILNEIDLEIQMEPNSDQEQQLRSQIENTFIKIDIASDQVVTNVTADSASYYIKAQSIIDTIKNDPYINQKTYLNYQSEFDLEYQKITDLENKF